MNTECMTGRARRRHDVSGVSLAEILWFAKTKAPARDLLAWTLRYRLCSHLVPSSIVRSTTIRFMRTLDRITHDPQIMGGKPSVRGMRVTVGTIVGLVAAGRSWTDILAAYPYLEEEDIRQSLEYADPV